MLQFAIVLRSIWGTCSVTSVEASYCSTAVDTENDVLRRAKITGFDSMGHQARLKAWAPLFATPPATIDYEKLAFYHTMEIPGLSRRVGQWDVGPGAESISARLSTVASLSSTSALPMGLSPLLSEQRGATVVTVDLPTDATYDLFPGPGMAAVQAGDAGGYSKHSQCLWLAHRTFNSQVGLVETHVTAIPLPH